MIAIWGWNTVDAGYDTSCWSGLWTVPTSTYASGIIYWCDGDIPVVSIHNEYWSGIIIKAMNEWTVTVKIWSWNDTSSYWSLYQRWNNYPFPNVADTTTVIYSWNSAVNASSYLNTSGYYESGTWVWQSIFRPRYSFSNWLFSC